MSEVISNPLCVVKPIDVSSRSDEVTSHYMVLDSIMKTWLLCRYIRINLALVTGPLIPEPFPQIPPRFNMRPFSVKNSSGDSSILPCLVQIKKNNRVEPSVNFYLILDDHNLILATPDPLILGQATIDHQKSLVHLEV